MPISPFMQQQQKRTYKEPICHCCGKSKSKDKKEHPLKRYCPDGVLSTKIHITFPHICEQKPCLQNCSDGN